MKKLHKLDPGLEAMYKEALAKRQQQILSPADGGQGTEPKQLSVASP